MPRKDGTGPMGQGAMTGIGLGSCTGVNAGAYGANLGQGHGHGIGFSMGCGYGRRIGFGGCYANQFSGLTDNELLLEQKEFLQERLDEVSKQLDSLE